MQPIEGEEAYSAAQPRQPITSLEETVRRCDWLKLIVLRVLAEVMLRLIGLLYITLTTIPHRQKGSARARVFARARVCVLTNVWALHCPQIRPSNKNRSGQASEPCK